MQTFEQLQQSLNIFSLAKGRVRGWNYQGPSARVCIEYQIGNAKTGRVEPGRWHQFEKAWNTNIAIQTDFLNGKRGPDQHFMKPRWDPSKLLLGTVFWDDKGYTKDPWRALDPATNARFPWTYMEVSFPRIAGKKYVARRFLPDLLHQRPSVINDLLYQKAKAQERNFRRAYQDRQEGQEGAPISDERNYEEIDDRARENRRNASNPNSHGRNGRSQHDLAPSRRTPAQNDMRDRIAPGRTNDGTSVRHDRSTPQRSASSVPRHNDRSTPHRGASSTPQRNDRLTVSRSTRPTPQHDDRSTPHRNARSDPQRYDRSMSGGSNRRPAIQQANPHGAYVRGGTADSGYGSVPPEYTTTGRDKRGAVRIDDTNPGRDSRWPTRER
jgi:hypothetical protein